MWAKCRATVFLPASLTLLACFAVSNSTAQQQPVEIRNVDLRSHYLPPLRIIHAQDAKTLHFGSSVVLEVIVSVGGHVESACAVDGPKEFFSVAESIERDRLFKPFEQDGVPVRALIRDWVQIAPPEQWANTRRPFPEIQNISSLRMSLSRTGCFGPCPAYSVEVRGSGDVIFRGDGNVLITGEHRARISRNAVVNLLEAFRGADYFSLRDGYTQTMTDCPTYTTRIEFDGQKKSVTDYVGSWAGMPDVVTELEDKIDELAGTEKWVHETSQTWPALAVEHWNFRAATDENRTLFASVVEHGSVELVQRFIAAGSPALVINKDGASPLVNAAEKGDLDLVRRMLGNQAQLPSQLLFRSLRAAAHSGNLDLMEFLISKGADVNGTSDDSNHRDTVLISAACSCKKEAVEEVLRYHPHVNAQDLNGKSALARFIETCPAAADIEGVVEFLIEAGADVNLKNDQGETPLFSACFNDMAVALLAQAGADLNTKDKAGQTALMHCVNTGFAKAMIAAGADLLARDGDGHTAAGAARQMGLNDKADLLEAVTKVASKHQQ
jgi:ankyrin repeat protein